MFPGKLKRSTLTNDICPSYCRKEKKDVKKKSKMGKEPWYPLFDIEKRQMVQLMDSMPPGVQMYDPSMASMDDMMEQMQYMYGDDMPEFDDEGNVIEKKKKKKKKGKKGKKDKNKSKDSEDGGIMDTIKGTINNGIDTVKSWLEPLWGDDGSAGYHGEM